MKGEFVFYVDFTICCFVNVHTQAFAESRDVFFKFVPHTFRLFNYNTYKFWKIFIGFGVKPTTFPHPNRQEAAEGEN